MKLKDYQELFVRNFTNCQPALYAFIFSLLPNRDNASDVHQDANLVMWRRSAEFAEGTNFLAWAYKILSHHRDRHVFVSDFSAGRCLTGGFPLSYAIAVLVLAIGLAAAFACEPSFSQTVTKNDLWATPATDVMPKLRGKTDFTPVWGNRQTCPVSITELRVYSTDVKHQLKFA